MAYRVDVTLSSTGLDQLLTSPYGPVTNHLRNIARRVQTTAKRHCPVYRGAPRRDGVQSGALRESINITQSKHPGGGFEFSVGSNLKYAYYVHEGTTGSIKPKHSRYMVFIYPNTGIMTYAKSVKGIKSNPFLRNALHEVVGR